MKNAVSSIKLQLEQLRSKHDLEAFSGTLSPSEALEILNICLSSSAEMQTKLLPILVGLHHPIFKIMIQHLTTDQLHLLQRESITEPLQHHLTYLSHDITQITYDLNVAVENLEQQIAHLNLEAITRSDVDALRKQVDLPAEMLHEALEQTKAALSLAWHTNRLDLIESFSTSREVLEKLQAFHVGHPESPTQHPLGIYAKIESRLHAVYNNPRNAQHEGALLDHEPVLEGLAKLSVWYLQDYWEIGLLPTIKSAEQLALDPAKSSEKERNEYKKKLLQAVRQNLESMGLTTVRDLKNTYIFSKKTLREYVQEHSA